MLDDLRSGKNYRSVRYMETIADYYDISSVNFADDVLKLLNDGKLVFKGDSKKENDGKIVLVMMVHILLTMVGILYIQKHYANPYYK